MWTPSALAREAKPLKAEVWRIVEAQHRVSTMQLTDTLEEQAILEALIEEAKPRVPEAAAHLDWLLSTPFRYAPYPHGSRFRRAGQRQGAFYASLAVETALAEFAFYRLLFFAQAPDACVPSGPADLTAFRASVGTEAALALNAPPLDADRAVWEHPTDYSACQELADAARAAGIGALVSRSVRDPRGGANVTVLAPSAFAKPKPTARQTWRLLLRPNGARAWSDLPSKRQVEFTRDDFAADPRLAN